MGFLSSASKTIKTYYNPPQTDNANSIPAFSLKNIQLQPEIPLPSPDEFKLNNILDNHLKYETKELQRMIVTTCHRYRVDLSHLLTKVLSYETSFVSPSVSKLDTRIHKAYNGMKLLNMTVKKSKNATSKAAGTLEDDLEDIEASAALASQLLSGVLSDLRQLEKQILMEEEQLANVASVNRFKYPLLSRMMRADQGDGDDEETFEEDNVKGKVEEDQSEYEEMKEFNKDSQGLGIEFDAADDDGSGKELDDMEQDSGSVDIESGDMIDAEEEEEEEETKQNKHNDRESKVEQENKTPALYLSPPKQSPTADDHPLSPQEQMEQLEFLVNKRNQAKQVAISRVQSPIIQDSVFSDEENEEFQSILRNNAHKHRNDDEKEVDKKSLIEDSDTTTKKIATSKTHKDFSTTPLFAIPPPSASAFTSTTFIGLSTSPVVAKPIITQFEHSDSVLRTIETKDKIQRSASISESFVSKKSVEN